MHFNVLLCQRYVYFHLYQQLLISFETLLSVHTTSLLQEESASMQVNVVHVNKRWKKKQQELYYARTTIVTLAELTLIWEFHGNTPTQVSIVCLQVEKSVG